MCYVVCMNIEGRLYNCFKQIFDEYDGNSLLEIKENPIIYDETGFRCSREFFNEMYDRWLNEKN